MPIIGSMHDWNVFQRSHLGRKCEARGLGNYCLLLGDCAYPTHFWMLPPFKGSKDGLLLEWYHWNYIQSSSRMPVEHGFGMLKARFRIMLKRCDMLLQNVPKMVHTCLVLHNMCIVNGDAFDERDGFEKHKLSWSGHKLSSRQQPWIQLFKVG